MAQLTHTKRIRETAEVRRGRILEEAIKLIGERGYYGFTIKELATRCGLTNPGLLHYFPSKIAVLLATIDEIEMRETEFMKPLARIAAADASDPEAVLDVLRAMMQRATADPAMVRFFFEMQTESLDQTHPGHSWWQQREDKTLRFFNELLRPHVADSEAVSRMVLAHFDGLMLQWLRAWPRRDIGAEWKRALSRLLPELFHTPPPGQPAAQKR